MNRRIYCGDNVDAECNGNAGIADAEWSIAEEPVSTITVIL